MKARGKVMMLKPIFDFPKVVNNIAVPALVSYQILKK